MEMLKPAMCDFGNIANIKQQITKINDNGRWIKRNLSLLERDVLEYKED